MLHGWLPLHAWSRLRRVAVAAVVAALACMVTVFACVASDVAGSTTAQAALAAARRDLADAQHAQRALPALKQATASETLRDPPKRHDSADAAHSVSELAAASGLSLVSLEPGARSGQGAESSSVLKVAAQGGFAQWRSFLQELAHAPALIVPGEVTIRRGTGSSLSLAATLSVFEALPSVPATVANDDAAARHDPFARSGVDGAGSSADLRLAGLIQDSKHAVVLIESPRGTDAVERGGRIDGERVVRIAMPGVTLAAGGRTRMLGWTEDRR
ncbi:MAG TPA: hypothetical protein VL689_01055 [Paraburkholderia sp.]|nr:hypothetical protein [Paraburkholderia sp.]